MYETLKPGPQLAAGATPVRRLKIHFTNAGDSASIPGWGTKIPHAAGQLSPHVATRKEDPVKQEKKGFFFF